MSIKELAQEAGVTSAFIHATFSREDESAAAPLKVRLSRNIQSRFLSTAKQLILTALRYQRFLSTPTDRLVTVFHATLDTFKAEPQFGKVVLQELRIGPAGEDNKAILDIFAHVDEVIREARQKGELGEEAKLFADWEVRQALFGLLYSLLRCRYLDEGRPSEAPPLDETRLAILVLRFLQFFCADDVRAKIDRIVDCYKQDLSSKVNNAPPTNS